MILSEQNELGCGCDLIECGCHQNNYRGLNKSIDQIRSENEERKRAVIDFDLDQYDNISSPFDMVTKDFGEWKQSKAQKVKDIIGTPVGYLINKGFEGPQYRKGLSLKVKEATAIVGFAFKNIFKSFDK